MKKTINPHAMRIILDVIMICVAIAMLCMLGCGCRSVKRDKTITTNSIDSNYYSVKDSIGQTVNTTIESLFKAKNFKLIIHYDSGTCKATPITTAKNNVATSFIESIIKIAGKPINSIEITADDLRDSNRSDQQTNLINTYQVNNGEKKEQVKQEQQHKNVESGSNLALIGAAVLVVILVLIWLSKKADVVLKPIEEIEKLTDKLKI